MKNYILDYIDYISYEKGLSNNTKTSYYNDLKEYEEFLSKKGINTCKDIKKDDIRAYLRYLDNNDLVLINNKKEEFEENYQSIISSIEYFIDEDGNNFGIVYANYEYRNELPEYIIEKGNPNSIKYLIIVAMDKGDFGQKSYRSIDKSFDVNHVAMKHGGGGHPGAAAVNISKDQKEKALSLPRREGLKYLAKR